MVHKLLQAIICIPVDGSRQESLKLPSVLQMAQDGMWLDGGSAFGRLHAWLAQGLDRMWERARRIAFLQRLQMPSKAAVRGGTGYFLSLNHLPGDHQNLQSKFFGDHLYPAK